MIDEMDNSLDDNLPVQDYPSDDNDGVPYCQKHHCRMAQASGGKKSERIRRFACPVPKCEETAKKIKTKYLQVVPTNPICCSRCSNNDKPVYCERDDASSSAAQVVLKCPSCGWKSNTLVVPQLAAAQFAHRQTVPTENVGDR